MKIVLFYQQMEFVWSHTTLNPKFMNMITNKFRFVAPHSEWFEPIENRSFEKIIIPHERYGMTYLLDG